MPSNIIAFDIGTAQVKLVWFAGKTYKLAVSAPVPDGLVRGGVIVSMDAMADFLWQLAKENGLKVDVEGFKAACRGAARRPDLHPRHRAAPHDRRPADL